MLEVALRIAQKAHARQFDKGGQPYINHPISVSNKMDIEDEKIVALLHDVCEDSDITLDDLRQSGFSGVVIDAVDCLTKRENETYGFYLNRISENLLAVKVKIADLEHNSDITRIPNIGPKDFKRLDKYSQALSKLKPLI